MLHVRRAGRPCRRRRRSARDRRRRCRRRSTPRPSTGSYRAARSRSRCSAVSTASSSTRAAAALQRDRREVAGVERRQRVERRREGERLTLFDVHVADVRRVDRLDAALAQRFVDGARDEVVRDVVQDLVLEALLDDARRRLARPEAGDARACASSRARRDRSRRRRRRSGFRRGRFLRVSLTSTNSVFMGDCPGDWAICGLRLACACRRRRSRARAMRAKAGMRKGGVEPP